jgi:pyruvate carboxylase subunit B
MAHALKNTGYRLDVDPEKMNEIEDLLNEGLEEYHFNPVTTTADARVVGFPMPGGAIGPNVHMMSEAGILNKYGDVLAEFPIVVKAGGAWTSVTPGSQQYWLQAFNNVLLGRWKKIEAGYGRAVLGYFGRPPLKPDPEVVRIASEQLELEPFDGDPLEAAADTLAEAEKALKQRDLPTTEENVFLVASAMVPGKDIELNGGLRLLQGKAKIVLPLKKKEEEKAPEPAAAAAPSAPQQPVFSGPVSTTCTVEENGTKRTFRITMEPPAQGGSATPSAQATPAAADQSQGIPVYSPFKGKVELVELKVAIGDSVTEGQVVAAVEAMKAKHDVRAPSAGKVLNIHAEVGSDVAAGQPILSIGP